MKKILIVDDDVVMLRLFQLQVRRAGCEGFFFSDAENALQWIEANRPDIAVLDYNLPMTCGMELLTIMRRKYASPVIPVIFVTGTADPVVLEEISQVPHSHVLSKPFSPRRLQTLIEACIND